MESQNLQGVDIAIATGISTSTINKYIHGATIPKLDNAFKIALFLGINFNDFSTSLSDKSPEGAV